ncbi:MAG: RNA-splicing ligase RtcB [Planctomycetaceae bacterium TMED240]|nr:RNA-splicing ligase RtcB [Rhodopirellula sp.]OUX08377.1 MAG: RNA-splicing ligase RtcB [Planctomycetaceae bacterium TMED240]
MQSATYFCLETPPLRKIVNQLIPTGDATAILPAGDHVTPIKVFGNESIRNSFDSVCLQQAVNCRQAPGVTEVILNPDAHCGYGAPIGCVLASPTHIYPGPVGFDIKCSMSLLQTNLPEDAVDDRRTRRELIQAIGRRIPTGTGKSSRHVPNGRRVTKSLGNEVLIRGASHAVADELGIPAIWTERCEDSSHTGHDGHIDSLARRLAELQHEGGLPNYNRKIEQLGSYGGGNHFGECEIVDIQNDEPSKSVASDFGLQHRKIAFLSHCGSRGIGHRLATGQFRALEEQFKRWQIPYPAGDKQLVYAPLGTTEADNYLNDMAMGANFATVNHLLINALVLEAFQEVIPGTQGELVYFISHNIAQREIIKGVPTWVHRKGATRALPAGHATLKNTPFANTGHPILLPGNPQAGSAVMVGLPGADKSCYSVNHGAGRRLGRRRAIREIDQKQVDASFEEADILTNCRHYPRDEAPAAYKDFEQVVQSVESAGLARQVARLHARFVIKDASAADD